MVHYLISCRSLTWAQRMGKVLERAGLQASTVKAPREIAPDGCGYCLRVTEKNLPRALTILREAGFDKSKIIAYRDDGVAL